MVNPKLSCLARYMRNSWIDFVSISYVGKLSIYAKLFYMFNNDKFVRHEYFIIKIDAFIFH